MQRGSAIFAMSYMSIQACGVSQPDFANSRETTLQPKIDQNLEIRCQCIEPYIPVNPGAKRPEVRDPDAIDRGMVCKVHTDADNNGFQPITGAGCFYKDSTHLVALDQDIIGPFALCGRQVGSDLTNGTRDCKAG